MNVSERDVVLIADTTGWAAGIWAQLALMYQNRAYSSQNRERRIKWRVATRRAVNKARRYWEAHEILTVKDLK